MSVEVSVSLKLYNTLGRELQDFNPITDGIVKMYTCGPTVYNYAHIGNLRAFIFDDVLRRTLEFFDYKVEHVMNITDVGHLTDDADDGEDKMIKTSKESGKSPWDIAKFYTNSFFSDTSKLNIKKPTTVCAATDHIQDMINLIKKIEENGFTYNAGGNVYFDTQKFKKYGELALLDKQEENDISRTEIDSNKKHKRDFVLWFTKSKFENQIMIWDSPWGKGYPGWHIECSALSIKYLGEQFDIHCGGIDHIPVHHTNEIAQAEAATGKKWVNYWLHNEFLVMTQGKMSKSKGNFITLQTLIDDNYDPLDFRYLCLGAHYRSQLKFSIEALESARASRISLFEKIIYIKSNINETNTSKIDINSYLKSFKESISNDLNTPKALADVWGVVKNTELSNNDKIAILEKMDSVIGLGFNTIDEVKDELEDDLLNLIKEREISRENKDYKRSDEIRDLLLEKGIIIKDSPKGTVWHRKL